VKLAPCSSQFVALKLTASRGMFTMFTI
jgi:hypothetical protein